MPPCQSCRAVGAVLLLFAAVSPLEAQRAAASSDGSAAGGAPSAIAAPRSMRAARAVGAVHLDGKLDERAWAAAEPSGDFTQSYPRPGEPAQEPTEVRVLYDDEALYVGVRMHDDDPAAIAAPLARRDASGIYSDWLHVVVDTYHDRRNAFRFSVNPRGIQKDVLHSDDRSEDLNWDAVWEVATRIDSAGWTAEYRIPYSQLRFGSAPPGATRLWGLQVQRDIARRDERDSWAPWSPNSGGFVAFGGDVEGFVDIPTPQRLELAPYVSSKVTRAPGNELDPFYRSTDTELRVGADLKMGLPRGLTLTATLNPDFGQVEVDPTVVNLSAFETFFPEKRPFFTEGASVFGNFGSLRVNASYGSQQFFYSRRVGRQPQLGPGGAAYSDVPDATTIIGAAKVSGKVGRWTVGLLDAVTDREEARIVGPDGDRGTVGVEPRTNYLVGRARRELRDGNTIVGGLLTATNRDLGGDDAFRSQLRSRAIVGGVDFEHLWNRRQWALSGYVVGSDVGGSATAIAAAQASSSRYFARPDAGHLDFDPSRTSLGGHMAELALQRSGTVRGSLDLKQVSPGFEVNDAGFQGRVDYRSATLSSSYSSVTAGDHLRSLYVGGGMNNAWNFDGDHIWNSFFGSVSTTLLNFWSAGLDGEYDPSVVSDRLTRGGPLGRTPASWSMGLSANSDSRLPVALELYGSLGGDEADGYSRRLSAGVVLRPSSSLRVSLGPELSVTRDMSQYVLRAADPAATETFGARYVFGELTQTVVSADTRVDWTFSPTLSLQLYAQPFVASGRYENYKSLRRPASKEYDPYTGALPGDPEFNLRSLRGNAVLRWEYRPGSAIFLVWQQQRQGEGPPGDFAFGRDWRGIFETRPANVFLVKASYWFAR
ncbi:MAG: DUF5916 domain-containing protein [Gemmatimonadaceae bacterium]